MPAFTGAPSALYPAGHVPTATEMKTWYDELNAASSSWTPFSTTWTSTGTAPVLGNGTITTFYNQVGKTVNWRGQMLFGSTTTFGTGIWLLTMPVTSVDSRWVGSAMYTHTTAVSRQIGVPFPNSTTQIVFYTTTAGQVTNTAPFTWTSGMSLSWSCTYEAA
jgi:hypothetical protein